MRNNGKARMDRNKKKETGMKRKQLKKILKREMKKQKQKQVAGLRKRKGEGQVQKIWVFS